MPIDCQLKLNTNEIYELLVKKLIQSRSKTQSDLANNKRKIAKKYKISYPSNAQLLKAYHELVRKEILKRNLPIENLLRIRKVRSLSGIIIVSVLTSSQPQWKTGENLSCPFKCLYCPTQKGIPKSYLSSEPAVMRAVLNKFDPYQQVQARIRALQATGHPTDKIELRIIGGTWNFYPKKYQTWFIKKCFQACNESNSNFRSLEKIQKRNEKAKYRIIGITIETRPDFIDKKEIKRLRKLGVTRVELGVQSIYNDILKLNKRGHKVEAVIRATKLLKDAGFKICYQMMPNLPGADLKLDEKMFEELFSSSSFQPDLLKIYPCSLLKQAPLYKWWQKGKYQPYKKRELIDLLKEISKKIPIYCRVQRIIRDISSQNIVEGPTKISNLRQVIEKELKEQGQECQCIRCREVKQNYNPQEKLYLFRKDYDASKGKEIFLSFETKKQKKLYGLLRLRVPSYIFNKGTAIIPALKNAAIIREIHIYGQLLPLQKQFSSISPQHKGLGKRLIKEAEKITKQEFGLKKITAISGIGVKPYWRKLGYRLKETYMIKKM